MNVWLILDQLPAPLPLCHDRRLERLEANSSLLRYSSVVVVIQPLDVVIPWSNTNYKGRVFCDTRASISAAFLSHGNCSAGSSDMSQSSIDSVGFVIHSFATATAIAGGLL